MSEHVHNNERQKFRHQIVLRDPVRYESIQKEKEFELKYHPARIPAFLGTAMRTTVPQLIEQVYVVVPVATKKGKRKLLEGRMRRISHPQTKEEQSFSVEKKKKRKGVGVNGEARLVLSAREERTLKDEFSELLDEPTVPKVSKLRYHIPQEISGVDGTVRFHVDLFQGANAGFVLIEVEFESKHAEKQFREHVPRELAGSEVTDIHAFRNSHIAFFGAPQGTHKELRAQQEMK